MSHYAKGTNLKSTSNGVGFYKHFPKNVIPPDRGIQELITVDSTALKNVTEAIKPINDILQPLQMGFIASK